MKNLTVWCVCVGDKYDTAYVYALKEAVEKNLTIPHRFICITPYKLDGIETRNPPVPFQGWWAKLGLFYPGIATGPSLYFDLDVVITGNLDYLVDYTKHQFAAPANWAQSGHGGIQSSVMAWSGEFYEPYNDLNWPKASEIFHGDQEYLWQMLGDEWVKIPGIGSYKYHVRNTNRIPEWMNVCVFHGKPDPHEVNDECLSRYTLTLLNLIKESTVNGSMTALKSTA